MKIPKFSWERSGIFISDQEKTMLVFSFRLSNSLTAFCIIFGGSFVLSRIYKGKVTNLNSLQFFLKSLSLGVAQFIDCCVLMLWTEIEKWHFFTGFYHAKTHVREKDKANT